MADMDELQFRRILQGEIEAAVNYSDSEFSSERMDAMRYYLSEPFGNEVENRSQVVCSEVSDTINYMLPTLMKIFASSKEFCKFEPRGPEDIKAAEQATDLVNFSLHQDNNLFPIMNAWFKDALLFKVGAVKAYYQEDETVTTDEYENLTAEELTLLLADPNVELVSQEVSAQGEIETFNVEIKRKMKSGCVKVDNIPPEELIFSRRSTSLETCDFIAHRTQMTVSELVALGYDEELVSGFAGATDLDADQETQARFNELESGEDTDSADPSMREVLVTESYIRCDYDSDGIAELRRVVSLGDGREVLENEPFDKVPFALLSPILMPHRMVGRSVAELVMDLQLTKSSIMRQMLDNLYLTNNARVGAVDGQVNMSDLLSSRPGGVVRMRAPGMVQPLAVPQIGQTGFNMLEYVDQMRDQRTGFSKASAGLDPDRLQSTTASAVNATIQGAQLKVEMIARVFAETGCRQLAEVVLHLLQKHQDRERVVRIRGEFVAIDPRAWSNGFDLTVEAGLGNGRDEEKAAMLMQVASKQEQLLQQLGPSNPVVKPSQYVNTLRKIVEMAGFKDTEQFFSSGEQIDQAMAQSAQQQKPDPAAEKAKAELALKREIEMEKLKMEREKMQAELELRRFEMQAELELRQQKLAFGGQISDNLPRA
jgi:hypothetical protein